MKFGYGVTLLGKYYFEVKFTDRRSLISTAKESLPDLIKSLPTLYQCGSNNSNIKKYRFKNTDRIGIDDKNGKRIALTTATPNDKTYYEFVENIALFFKGGEKSAPTTLECLRDDSKNTARINSITSFLTEIEKIIKDKKDTLFFRGHSSYLYEMQPSIYRKRELINNEDVIYKELLIRCPFDFEKLSTTFETLVKMQHYSLPTRLLDLTSNPLIALYFACENYEKDKNEGEVKVLSIPKSEIKYYDSDTVTVISNLAKQPKTFNSDCIKNKNKQGFTRFMDDIKKEKSYFEDRITDSSINNVVCVKPKLNNSRIIKQDGSFLLFGISKEKQTPSKIPQNYLIKKRLIINNKSKENILEQLEKIGISSATIYPEIDKVSNYISLKYGKPEEIEDDNMPTN